MLILMLVFPGESGPQQLLSQPLCGAGPYPGLGGGSPGPEVWPLSQPRLGAQEGLDPFASHV